MSWDRSCARKTDLLELVNGGRGLVKRRVQHRIRTRIPTSLDSFRSNVRIGRVGWRIRVKAGVSLGRGQVSMRSRYSPTTRTSLPQLARMVSTCSITASASTNVLSHSFSPTSCSRSKQMDEGVLPLSRISRAVAKVEGAWSFSGRSRMNACEVCEDDEDEVDRVSGWDEGGGASENEGWKRGVSVDFGEVGVGGRGGDNDMCDWTWPRVRRLDTGTQCRVDQRGGRWQPAEPNERT